MEIRRKVFSTQDKSDVGGSKVGAAVAGAGAGLSTGILGEKYLLSKAAIEKKGEELAREHTEKYLKEAGKIEADKSLSGVIKANRLSKLQELAIKDLNRLVTYLRKKLSIKNLESVVYMLSLASVQLGWPMQVRRAIGNLSLSKIIYYGNKT